MILAPAIVRSLVAAAALYGLTQPGVATSLDPAKARPAAAATAPPASASAEAQMEAGYAAARKGAEKRQDDWDRKMKQLAKDVCTGC